MTRPNAWLPLPVLWLLLILLSAQALDALDEHVVLQITLDPIAYRYTGPTVTSFAEATLYDRSGRLPSELIYGHRVNDLTNQFVIFEKRIVTPTGSSSTSCNERGLYDTCYDAQVVAHVNAFNIHRSLTHETRCMVVVDITKPPPPPDDNCPVLLDLDLNGFHLSGPAVSFDIDADGVLDRIAWTKAGEEDAFLCLDRNHNGVIDDGHELFGHATPLVSGHRARVGYRALEELDGPELGGNQDGQIDARDLMFRELCAWVDTNQDGVSQADEIHSLDQVGVAALEYDYRPIRMWDQHGNLFRYVSQVEMHEV